MNYPPPIIIIKKLKIKNRPSSYHKSVFDPKKESKDQVESKGNPKCHKGKINIKQT